MQRPRFRTSFLLVCLALGSMPALADTPGTGSYQTTFDQTTPLAGGIEVFKRLVHPMAYDQKVAEYHPSEGQVIDPAREHWQVYVPEDYDASKPYGVLVWVAPWDELGIPSGWQSVLKAHHLIYVAAGNSGNDQSVPLRRVPLALTGLANIEARYKTDPARLYIAGFSGGGVTASVIAAEYADVFTGGMFVATSYGLGTDDEPVPPLDRLHLMQSRGRYVFLAGTEDPINEAMTNHASSAYMEHCVLRVRKLNMLNAGHRDVDPRYLSSALNYLDSPPDIKPGDRAGCEQKLQAERDEAIAAVRTALAADDRDKAKSALTELHMVYGPLADPEFSQLDACVFGTEPTHSCAAGKP
jgi:hypothetical protein